MSAPGSQARQDPGEVEVRIHGSLLDFVPTARRGRPLRRPILGHPAVKDVVEAVGVPHPEIGRLLVRGEPVGLAHRLAPGDVVDAYPVGWPRGGEHEDGDERSGPGAGSSTPGGGPGPMPDPRFVLDGHLGRLAAHLRMCGFDTRYRRDADDAALAHIAATEDRILLTRDVGLLKRSAIRRGAFVRSDRPRDQLVEILGRFGLAGSVRPFSRCLRCNGRLEPVDRATVRAVVPPRVLGEQDAFRRCERCGGIYWRGSHHRRMTGLLDGVLAEVEGTRPRRDTGRGSDDGTRPR